MKVVFVSTLYTPNERGGAERTVRIIAEALVANGHEAAVISLAPDGVAREGEVNGVRTYYVPLANLFWKQSEESRGRLARMAWHFIDAWNPVMAVRVRRILEREQPDLVQTGNLQGFSVSLWRTVRRMNIPLVQMLHDYYLGCPKCTMTNGTRNCAKQCAGCRVYSTPRRLTSNLPAAVISLSRRMLTRLEGTGLFAGVAHKFIIHGASDARIQATPRANRPAGTPIVAGYLGRMEKDTKGIEVLLDAACKLAPGSVTVLLGGKGDDAYVDELKRTYAGSHVQFLGFVKPAEFLERIDVLVVPSVWEEPLGRVIYEAYAQGVPAIVADVGGMPEIVDPGRTGFVFRSRDSDDLARLLRAQIDAGWRGADFCSACIARSADFSIERAFADYMRVWETALRTQSPGGGHRLTVRRSGATPAEPAST